MERGGLRADSVIPEQVARRSQDFVQIEIGVIGVGRGGGPGAGHRARAQVVIARQGVPISFFDRPHADSFYRSHYGANLVPSDGSCQLLSILV